MSDIDWEAECERLRGIKPEFPPRPPHGEGLPRYGLRWNGPESPLAAPMADGYWTPWHLADAECERLREALGEIDRMAAIAEMPWPPGGQHVGVKQFSMAISTARAVRRVVADALATCCAHEVDDGARHCRKCGHDFFTDEGWRRAAAPEGRP